MQAVIFEGRCEFRWGELNGGEPGALALKGAFEMDETGDAFTKKVAKVVGAAQARVGGGGGRGSKEGR